MTQPTPNTVTVGAHTDADNIVLSIRNAGPILEAESVALRPLTIFAGPGNTGKSYLATLIYAFQQTFNVSDRRLLAEFATSSAEDFNHGWLKGAVSQRDWQDLSVWIRRMLHSTSTFREAPLSLSVLERSMTDFLVDRSTDMIAEELTRLTGAQPPESRNWSAAEGTFEIEVQDSLGGWRLSIAESGPGGRLNTEVTVSTQGPVDLNEMIPNWRRSFLYRSTGIHDDIKQSPMSFAAYLSHELRFKLWQAKAKFLPASRSGLIQGHRAIVGATLRRVARVGIEPLIIPTLTGVVADFLSDWVELGMSGQFLARDTDPLPLLAGQLAKEVMHGEIAVELRGNNSPTFFYIAENPDGTIQGRIPLELAASTITETAPLVLWLRHYLSPGDTLILEEPEAHLHPKAQRTIAKILVLAVNAGLRVIITTHSPFILEQISNYMRYHQLDRRALEEMTERNPEGISLDPRMAGCYSFRQTSNGAIVEELSFDPETGFYPDDHADEEFDLHNEVSSILNSLDVPS